MHGDTTGRQKTMLVTTITRGIRTRRNGYVVPRDGKRKGIAKSTCSSENVICVNGKSKGMRGIDMRIHQQLRRRMTMTGSCLDHRRLRRLMAKVQAVFQDPVATNGKKREAWRIARKIMQEVSNRVVDDLKMRITRGILRV